LWVLCQVGGGGRQGAACCVTVLMLYPESARRLLPRSAAAGMLLRDDARGRQTHPSETWINVRLKKNVIFILIKHCVFYLNLARVGESIWYYRYGVLSMQCSTIDLVYFRCSVPSIWGTVDQWRAYNIGI
jgi:hypothetical protein